jgi:hypothetical protein
MAIVMSTYLYDKYEHIIIIIIIIIIILEKYNLTQLLYYKKREVFYKLGHMSTLTIIIWLIKPCKWKLVVYA